MPHKNKADYNGWFRKDRARDPEKYQHKKRLERYGLTKEQYEALLEVQDNRCAICRIPFGVGKKEGPHVDHDHETGLVRGLLCNSCNGALGLAKDNTETLEEMIRYLKRRGD